MRTLSKPPEPNTSADSLRDQIKAELEYAGHALRVAQRFRARGKLQLCETYLQQARTANDAAERPLNERALKLQEMTHDTITH